MILFQHNVNNVGMFQDGIKFQYLKRNYYVQQLNKANNSYAFICQNNGYYLFFNIMDFWKILNLYGIPR